MRSNVSLFSATLNVTFPFPLPLAPAVTVMHGALLAAVQLHDEGAETDDVVQVHSGWVATAMLPAPPAASMAD